MADLDWHRTEDHPSPEGEVVWAMDSGGHVQRLKRSGNLWFFPDGSMYVYFTPVFWKEIESDD